MLPSLKNIGVLVGKRVLVRADFNVPVSEGVVAPGADWRLKVVLPTLEFLSNEGAKIIILAHLGRPKNHDLSCSLYPIFLKLVELWRPGKLFFSTDILGERVEKQIAKLKNGEAILLENLRFYREEEANDESFAQKLAAHGEIYVNDAFADSHRAHASIVGIPKFLKSYAGFLLEKEVAVLEAVRVKPRRPLVLVMGGAKAETKLKLVKEFMPKSEGILLGGVLANTLFRAQGTTVGQSVVDQNLLAEAKKLNIASRVLRLPVDVLVSKSMTIPKDLTTKPIGSVGREEFIMDIGPDTVNLFVKVIKTARMIIWNGTLGVTEISAFKKGSLAVARAIAESSGEKIIGGGDLINFLAEENLLNSMTYVSTGGGAMLEFLAGGGLPGIKVLE